MNDHETNVPEPLQQDALQRKPYTAPLLTDFGSVAEVTRAGFPEYLFGS